MPVEKEKLLQRGIEIIEKASSQELSLRLIGGAAIALLAKRGADIFKRTYKDIDLFGLSSQSRKISYLLESIGMIPNKRFNALHGFIRLMYYDPVLESTVDVFLDEFNMCHKLVLKNRLSVMKYTVPSSDLLLTKLQIVKITENDFKDVGALLYDLEFSDHDSETTIDLNYIVELLSDDWGFYTTVMDNISKGMEYFSSYSKEGDVVIGKLKTLKETLEKSPKSLKWKMRAKIGRKVKWYEEPEEVGGFKPDE
ncbi:MAG: hypothetical protein JZD40_06035 [Sulfolobus sp.]|nr:hypothetical protein [Sulfolobus sp.]